MKYNQSFSLIVMIIISLIFIAILNVSYYSAVSNLSFPISDKVIIIDPGHGGVDPGAVGKAGMNESEINLKISIKLKDYFQESGAAVVMTRETAKGLYDEEGTLRHKKNEDLKRRREIAQNAGGDIFISIHLNSFPQSQYYGAQTFYLKNDEHSKKLAMSIQDELIKVLNRGNKREIKESDSYYILKGHQIPAVLVECGFLSNPEEERLLNTDKYQQEVAWAIYVGVIKYIVEQSG
ncbi:MAG: N-acetylmuramoyl-L-alanine amidase CwlD [Clostridia bacterium]|nr:N-acetylmuramoyl-L-alanine amidase CwlD [Clostridia bacterium]